MTGLEPHVSTCSQERIKTVELFPRTENTPKNHCRPIPSNRQNEKHRPDIKVSLSFQVVPTIAWRGAADIIAVFSYIAGVIPLFSIALLEMGMIGKGRSESEKMKLHFILLTVFLVVAHVAMVFGMLDPTVMGWNPAGAPMAPGGHMKH